METVALNNGLPVLARQRAGELTALSYANETQARACAARLGVAWTTFHPPLSRPWYVCRRLDLDTWRIQKETAMLGTFLEKERRRAAYLLRFLGANKAT